MPPVEAFGRSPAGAFRTTGLEARTHGEDLYPIIAGVNLYLEHGALGRLRHLDRELIIRDSRRIFSGGETVWQHSGDRTLTARLVLDPAIYFVKASMTDAEKEFVFDGVTFGFGDLFDDTFRFPTAGRAARVTRVSGSEIHVDLTHTEEVGISIGVTRFTAHGNGGRVNFNSTVDNPILDAVDKVTPVLINSSTIQNCPTVSGDAWLYVYPDEVASSTPEYDADYSIPAFPSASWPSGHSTVGLLPSVALIEGPPPGTSIDENDEYNTGPLAGYVQSNTDDGAFGAVQLSVANFQDAYLEFTDGPANGETVIIRNQDANSVRCFSFETEVGDTVEQVAEKLVTAFNAAKAAGHQQCITVSASRSGARVTFTPEHLFVPDYRASFVGSGTLDDTTGTDSTDALDRFDTWEQNGEITLLDRFGNEFGTLDRADFVKPDDDDRQNVDNELMFYDLGGKVYGGAARQADAGSYTWLQYIYVPDNAANLRFYRVAPQGDDYNEPERRSALLWKLPQGDW